MGFDSLRLFSVLGGKGRGERRWAVQIEHTREVGLYWRWPFGGARGSTRKCRVFNCVYQQRPVDRFV